jgi:phage baseplate assembly protein gpV
MSNFGYPGTQEPASGAGDFGALSFLVNQILATISTVTLVKIVAVTNNGGVSPVGFVDVQPLVNQTDGAGNATPHGVVYGLPYFRLQGGTNAIILDPQVGDIGMCGFASRDISSVKASKAQANPGSGRVFDMADGLYFGGMLNGTPTQYVQFSAIGINVVSPTKITLQAPLVEVDASTSFTVNSPSSRFSGAVIIQGLLSWLAGMTGSVVSGVASVITGAVQFVGTITSNGKRIDDTHSHNGVQPGSGNSGNVN